MPLKTLSRSRSRRRAVQIALVTLLLLFIGLITPGSPVHLSVLLRPAPTDNGRTVTQLTHSLADPDPEVRKEAAAGLGRLNVNARNALPQLAVVLRNDPEPKVRAAAAEAITKMTPFSQAVVAELAAALHDTEPLVRMNAAQALLRLKAEASPAIADLVVAATDEDNDTNIDMFSMTIRQAVLQTLGTAAEGTGAGVATFAEVLDSPSPDMSREIAARGLGLAGPHARESASLIRALLRDHNPRVRQAAEDAIALIGIERDGPTRIGEFESLELPESERQRIWEIEHRGNVLNVYGFEPLSSALLQADSAALARFLSPDFVGSDIGSPTSVKWNGMAEVERLQSSGSPPASLTAAQFVSRMLELRKYLGAGPKVKLVVATLQPKNPDQLDGVWEGQALLRIHGESSPGAPAEVTALLGFEVRSPTEGTLGAGGWLRAAHIRQVAVARSPQALFVETAKARGLNTQLHDNWTAEHSQPTTGGVYVTDFDRDGYLDVLIVDLTGTTLYRGGPGGQFTDVTKQMNLPQRKTGASQAAAWVDLDGDGWEDLIMDMRVFRNEGGTGFVDYTDRCNLTIPYGLSGIIVADCDRDGKLDLYLTRPGPPGNLSWLEGRSNDAQGNRLFRNLGNWKFEDVTKKSGTRGGYRSTFTAAWLDANDDGWPDLYVPNEFGDGVLLVNKRDGTFKPRALSDHPPSDFGTMGLAAGDIDNDGHIDIYSANMYSKAGTRVIGNLKADAYPPQVMTRLRRLVAGSELHLNKGDLKFQQVGAEKQLASVGWVYGAALADLDGDGFLDVYATAGYFSRDRNKPDG